MGRIIRFPWGTREQRSARALSGVETKVDEHLIQALDDEMWDVGIQIAVLTSYLNYLDTFEMWLRRSELLRWVPTSPIVLGEASRELADLAGQSDWDQSFSLFERYLKHAKRLLEGLVTDRCQIIGLMERDEVVGAWQSTAGCLLICLYERDRLLDHLGRGRTAQEQNPLADVLIKVRDGGAPLVEQDSPCLPDWAHRRRHRRTPLNEMGLVQVGGKRHAIRILDVSQSGIGLDFVKELEVDAIVAVTMQSGRRFWGRVAWTANGRPGIEFAAPLAATDPLLSSG